MNELSEPFSLDSAVSDIILFYSLKSRLCLPYFFEKIIDQGNLYRRFRLKMHSRFLSGSTAEFYIQPMFGYFGDTDMMYCLTDVICVIEDKPSLPNEFCGFEENIRCSKIITDFDLFPGYCFLKQIGEFIYNWDSEMYNFLLDRVDQQPYLFWTPLDLQWFKKDFHHENQCRRNKQPKNINHITEKRKWSGPAMNAQHKIRGFEGAVFSLTFESVACIWCPHWPLEAADWPSRPRKHHWPTKATIQNVVGNGFHLVPVSHPDCPEDLRKYQWRISFSYAEIILIRSWTPIQQVVYHIFRYFAKRELMKKDCPKQEEVLTGYHLKTLMLWMCEEKPDEWWFSAPIVFLLCQILTQLSKLLKIRHIRNYFMPQANLLRKNLHKDNLSLILQKVDRYSKFHFLDYWFMENYRDSNPLSLYPESSVIDRTRSIPKMAPLFPEENNVYFETKLINYIFECLYVVLSLSGKGLYNKVEHRFQIFEKTTYSFPLSPDLILKAVDRWSSSQFLSLTSIIVLLYVQYCVSCEEMAHESEFLADSIRGIPMEIKSLCLRSHSFPDAYRSKFDKSFVCLLRAQEVLETITNPTRDPEFHALSQIALAILKQCLVTHDAESKSLRCTALVYLAAIYFVTQDFQTAIALCSEALTLYDHGQLLQALRYGMNSGSTRSLNAFCLLFIDDVARIAGFILLLKKFGKSLFDTRKHLRINAPVFALYLLSSVAKNFPEYSDLFRRLDPSNLSASDAFLFIRSKRIRVTNIGQNKHMACCVYQRRCVYLRADPKYSVNFTPINSDGRNFSDFLFRWSLDLMKQFSKDILDKYDIDYDVFDCYSALYFYKCCRYKEVTRLCGKILSEPRNEIISQGSLRRGVIIFPPFDGFFDKDIQSLLGLQTLCLFCLPLEAKWKPAFSEEEIYIRTVAASGVQSGQTLSCMDRYLQASLYVLSKHFLVHYLLVNTDVALGKNRSQVYDVYRRINCRFHFEVVVHTFLYRQLTRKGFLLGQSATGLCVGSKCSVKYLVSSSFTGLL